MDALILAGGKSSRMGGEHKGSLSMGEETFTAHLVSQLKPLADKLWISYGETVQQEIDGCTIVRDEYIDCGPMGGLHAGLKACSSDILLVAACDMPLLKRDLYDHMLELLLDYDGVVPVTDGQMHPLAAIYTKALFPIMEQALKDGNFRLRSALEQANIRYVDVPQFNTMLSNINTKEEYQAFLKQYH